MCALCILMSETGGMKTTEVQRKFNEGATNLKLAPNSGNVLSYVHSTERPVVRAPEYPLLTDNMGAAPSKLRSLCSIFSF